MVSGQHQHREGGVRSKWSGQIKEAAKRSADNMPVRVECFEVGSNSHGELRGSPIFRLLSLLHFHVRITVRPSLSVSFVSRSFMVRSFPRRAAGASAAMSTLTGLLGPSQPPYHRYRKFIIRVLKKSGKKSDDVFLRGLGERLHSFPRFKRSRAPITGKNLRKPILKEFFNEKNQWHHIVEAVSKKNSEPHPEGGRVVVEVN